MTMQQHESEAGQIPWDADAAESAAASDVEVPEGLEQSGPLDEPRTDAPDASIRTGPEVLVPEPVKRTIVYVVLVWAEGAESAFGAQEVWRELGKVSAPTKPGAWEQACDRFPQIRVDGAQAQLVPERFWRPVTTRERVREPEFTPEGL
jgi:hypothetical protein